MNMFYSVRAVINHPLAPRKTLMEGIYMSKQDEVDGKKIKKQCEDFIRERIGIKAKTKAEREQMRKELVIKISYKKLPEDFVVMDKE